jgi:arylsulfatase
LFTAAQAAVVQGWAFNSSGNTEDWGAFKDISGVAVANAINGSDVVLTSSSVTGNDAQLRYNTGGTDANLWLSPGTSTWSTIELRIRLLDKNPGDAGVASKVWPASADGTLVFFNQGLSDGLNTSTIDAAGGWTITSEADNWITATYDISSLGTAVIKSLRLDPIAQDTTGNFEIDWIQLNAGTTVPPVEPPISSGPNIIYIIADDMGYSDPGCYGGEIDTPNIDRLAEEGIRFRHFYDCAKCETSRSSLMSGLYHGRSGLNIQNGASLGSAMQSGGYRTYAVGKWHLGDVAGRRPTERGFDNYYGHYSGASPFFPSGIGSNKIYRDTAEPNNFISAFEPTYFTQDSSTFSRQTSFPSGFYLTDAFGDNAVEFIDDAVENHTNRPFFMYLAFNAPHTPLQAPVAAINKYRNTYTNGWDVLRQERWQRQLASGLVDPQWQLPNLRDDIPRWDDLDAAAQDAEDHRRAVYAAMIDVMDQNIGKVLDHLDQLDATTHPGILTNTLVIFSSDNGAQAFDNATEAHRLVNPDDPDSKWNQGAGWAALSGTPWRYYKQSQLQGGICTPFVARWPGTIAEGQTTDQPGHFVDVMATFVDVADIDYASLTDLGGSPVPPMDGKSLQPIFTGGTRPAPDYWGFEYNRSEFAVIKGDWKIAAFSSSPWRLYNLKDDRTETRNLRWENPAKMQELAALYDAWAADTYGSSVSTYANRDTLAELRQELRYEVALTGALYSEPSIGITVTNIGTVVNTGVEDHWEILPIQTASAGVGGTADSFTFVCKPFFGDGELIAQVESLSGMLAAGHAGVMLRETLANDSAFVMSALKSSGQAEQTLRSTAGDPLASFSTGSGIAAPAFLRVKRVGDVFTTSYSTDGFLWVDIATSTNAMGPAVYAGLAAASGGGGTTATLTFREWENRDTAQYPGQLRSIDGLSQLLGYALGADEQTDATDRLPSIRMTNDVSATYPEITYTRRINTNGLHYGFLGGTNLNSLGEDSVNWTEVASAPQGDGVSEDVVFKRSIDTDSAPDGFYQLVVEQQ